MKCQGIFLLLSILFISTIQYVHASLSKYPISSYGTINYSSPIIIVDFEKDEHFQWGYGKGTAPIWDRCIQMGEGEFVPSTDIFHSGVRSAKLSLADPSTDHGRRLHIYQDWDSEKKDLTVEAWIYFPTEFVVNKWTHFLQILAERYHPIGTPWKPPYTEELGIGIVICDSTKVGEGKYLLETKLNHGWIDNNHDGVNDLAPREYFWSKDPIIFGQWNHIKIYVHRGISDGIYKCWLNGNLQWDKRNARTMGLTIGRYNVDPSEVEVRISSGLSLYTIVDGTPKTAYFDDIVFDARLSSET